MPVQRSPLDLIVPDMPVAKFPHSLLETAVLQSAMSTLVDFNANTRMTYDAATRRFIVLNPAGSASGEAYMTQSGHRWSLLADYNAGATYPVTPHGIAADGSGTVMLCGWTSASPTKMRRTTNGGGSWGEVNVGDNNGDDFLGIGYSAALGLWIAGASIQGLWTSPDGVDFNWTQREAGALDIGNFYCRNTGGTLVMASGVGTPTDEYYTTTNGVTFTQRTFPAALSAVRGCYSEYWKLFYAHSATNTYTSPDAVTWTVLHDYPNKISAHGHLLLSGDGYLSSDGGYNWASCIEVLTSADWIGSAHGRTLFRDGDTFLVSAGTLV